jgi:hypothetical protein
MAFLTSSEKGPLSLDFVNDSDEVPLVQLVEEIHEVRSPFLHSISRPASLIPLTDFRISPNLGREGLRESASKLKFPSTIVSGRLWHP